MNHQFETTPQQSTLVAKNRPIPKNIIMKIENTGDKTWILPASKDKKQHTTGYMQKSEWL